MPQRQVSTTHSTRTLTVSRERQKPASSIVKPACMPNTRKAATSVHTVLRGFMTGLTVASDIWVVLTMATAGAEAAAAGAEAAAAIVSCAWAAGVEKSATPML